MRLIFATNNQHKAEEIQAAIGNCFELVTLKDAGINIEIPEPHDTLQANASEKSWTIYKLTGTNCFSEDTGLEVEALQGAPGVKSARYAGENRSFDKNIEKLLFELENNKNRKARFRTVISLIINGQEVFFEGVCNGTIELRRRGTMGFGYDPVFSPLKSSKTFAEMSIEEKGFFSHRRLASDQLVAFLQRQAGKIY
jgi:XTP/dITP diphosphohydrolase